MTFLLCKFSKLFSKMIEIEAARGEKKKQKKQLSSVDRYDH